MEELTNRIRAIRRKKLVRWAVRQVISACIMALVVWKWPHLSWLIYIWAGLALLALVVICIGFKKLEARTRAFEALMATETCDGEKSA